MKTDKVNRLEVINHSDNNLPIGLAFVFYAKEGEEIKLEYQDDGRTIKIFITRKTNQND